MQKQYSRPAGALEETLGLTPKDFTLYGHLQRPREALMSAGTPALREPFSIYLAPACFAKTSADF
jgi:hypothetical protein